MHAIAPIADILRGDTYKIFILAGILPQIAEREYLSINEGRIDFRWR